MIVVIFLLFLFPSLSQGEDTTTIGVHPDQWALLNNSPASIGWRDEMAEVDMKNIYFIVLDTGGCPEHSDMPKLFWSWNVFTSNTDVTDTYGHGCAVSSINAARGIGMMGLSRSANFLTIKALNPDGQGTTLDVVEGIYRSINKVEEILLANPQARFIMPLAFGRPTSDSNDPSLNFAVQIAVDHGIIVLIAAGNNGLQLDGLDYTPHAETTPEKTIVVCAVNKEGQLVDQNGWKSNFGPKSVFICAPGVDIRATAMLQPIPAKGAPPLTDSSRVSGYMLDKGTSIAVQFVAGALAHLLAQDSSLTIEQIKEKLNLCGKPMVNGELFSMTGKMLGLCPTTQ